MRSSTVLATLLTVSSTLPAGCGTSGPPAGAQPGEIAVATSALAGEVDVVQMAENIQADLEGQAVGWAYAINKNGVLTRTGSDGSARRAVDGALSMNSTRRQQVASVNKTITAVATLRLIEANGLTIDSPISPWLPPAWVQGLGVWNGLTFRHLLTHTSGLGQRYDALSPADQARWGNDWDGLEYVVSNGAQPGAAYRYINANFALLRVIVPALWKASPLNPGIGAITDGNHGALFLQFARQYIFEPSGVPDAACWVQPSYEAAYGYDRSVAGQSGRTGNTSLANCGGHAGLHLSARDLAAFMSHLRYDNAILSPIMRLVMDAARLGWDDDSNTNANGRLGKFWHGGDWYIDGREWHTCVMKYPQNVEATLVVNSQIGSGKNQCTILKDAFNNAL